MYGFVSKSNINDLWEYTFYNDDISEWNKESYFYIIADMENFKNDYDFKKIEDKLYDVRYGDLDFFISPFLNLPYQLALENAAKKLSIPYLELNSGERKVVVFGSVKKQEIINPIIVFKIKTFEALKHNEIMGAILGLGIKREMVGNIYAKDGIYMFEALEQMSSFIQENLNYVSRYKVNIELTSEVVPTNILKEDKIIVSSLRLDNVVSSAFDISRDKAKEMIENEEVQYNYSADLKCDQKIEIPSFLSCRRKGKILITEIDGKTKKDKIILKINKY